MDNLWIIFNKKTLLHFVKLVCYLLISGNLFCQNTNIRGLVENTSIRGFVDVQAAYDHDRLSFSLGEQDLFITSELTDRLSFLGESVFRFDSSSSTQFSVSVERIVLKFNYAGNHNILAGKHHTPLNYWNDTYHHGRLFFPTIDRPLLFSAEIIPLHTTGVGLQGHNLGALKFGYDLMVGNGLGAAEVRDNNKNKSLTAAIHIKPTDNLRIGATYYYDVISKGSTVHGKIINWKVNQHLTTASIAHFGKKLELLAESTLAMNKTDTTGSKETLASYLYSGYRITEKWVPYIRVDDLHYQTGEVYYMKNNTFNFIAGLRYQISYLAVIKLEYQYRHSDMESSSNRLGAQLAIGF
jgi:hypothetical protein